MNKTRYFSLFLILLSGFLVAKPKPIPRADWAQEMDYGPFIATIISETIEDDDPILKGLAISIGKNREYKIAYDTALLQMTGAWKGGLFFNGTPWNGRHGGNPSVEGDKYWWSKKQPGWAVKGSTADPREIPFGNLPKNHSRFKGLYRNGDSVVLQLSIQGRTVYESYELIETAQGDVIARHFNIPETGNDLMLLVTDLNSKVGTSIKNASDTLNIHNNAKLAFVSESDGRHLLKIPANQKNYNFSIYYSPSKAALSTQSTTPDLSKHLNGGPAHWPKTMTVQGILSDKKDTYVSDQIPIPAENPYGVKFRSGGFDFFSNGTSAAFCTWNGDVWIASGIEGDLKNITWRRYASGLFETIGVKIVDDVVYVTGKDQITRLHDLNNDGEADHYECFNNDIMITKNFHEFTFGLQTDPEGNFYFAKGASVRRGGRNFELTHKHHGIVLKVSKDGEHSEVFANGLRAPGGLAVSPDGSVVTTGENEGTYVPACKINWATKGTFHGVIHEGNGKTEADGYDLPLCWMPMWADNSGGGQVWVPDNRWGYFKGELLHLSYGQCSIFKVMKEEVDGQVQGGVSRIPVSFSSSAMRARFNKRDGQLYVLGFQGWQTKAASLCGFQRVRYTGNKLFIPKDLETTSTGVKFTFTDKIDPESALNPNSYKVSRFNYLYCSQYGSGTFSLNAPKELIERGLVSESKRFASVKDIVFVKSVTLLDDGYSIHLELEDMQKANQIEYEFQLKSASGKDYSDKIFQTVHKEAKHTLDSTQAIAKKEFKQQKIDWSEYKQGLVSSYTQNDKITDQSISRTVANRHVKGELPAFGLKHEPYTLTYEGYIHIKEVGSFQLLFDDPSKMLPDIQIGPTTIRYITPSYRPKPNQLLPVMSLPIGLHKFKMSKLILDPKKDYRFRLLWQWQGKALEPISPELFYHKPTPKLEKKLALRTGRELVGSKQCTACHSTDLQPGEGMPEIWERAPSLKTAGTRLNKDWIQAWLLNPKAMRHNAKMPDLFKGDKEKAGHVAAYLSQLGQDSNKSIDQSASMIKKGGGLFNDLGCISCHSSPSSVSTSTERLPLHYISHKYQPAALVEFLLKPEAHHKDTAMPNFNLERKEAEALASFLIKESTSSGVKYASAHGDAMQGKAIVNQMGCANCHELEGVSKINAPKLDSLSGKNGGCLSAGHANYNLTATETSAIKTALSKPETFSTHLVRESSERAIQQMNCIACHTRDGKSDLWSKFGQESAQWKVEHEHKGHLAQDRPSLTHAGEKLNQDYIHHLLKGDLGYNARPWLLAKMPSFPSRAERISLGLTSQHGVSISKQKTKPVKAKIDTGHRLTGSQGFSCIVCHGVGKSKPLAAFEVEGINLGYVADRLRPSFFQRWMLDPTRIDPKTKMPRYTIDGGKTGLSHIQEGDAQAQFESIWQYLQKGMKMKKPMGMP